MFTRAWRGESEIGLYRWGMGEGKKKKKQRTPNGDGQIAVERRSNTIGHHDNYGEG
jgi:hypothetical protein